MKITSVDIIDVANDFASATSKWRPVVVKINTDEGISGFGEVGLAYGVGASRHRPGADRRNHEKVADHYRKISQQSACTAGRPPVFASRINATLSSLR